MGQICGSLGRGEAAEMGRGMPQKATRSVARWTQLTLDNTPCGRSSHRLTGIAGAAYLYGGESKPRIAIDSTVHRLNMALQSWEALAPSYAPPLRVAHAQAAVDGKLLIFGGLIGDGRPSDQGDLLDDCWSFDPEKVEWTKLEPADGKPPAARSYHCAAGVGETLYIFGGCSAKGRLADLHAFHVPTRTWKELAAPPELRGRGGATLAVAADGKRLWVCAGFAGEETNDLVCYDLEEKAWKRIESSWLRKHSVAASMSLDSGVFVFGGEIVTSAKGHAGAGTFTSDLVGFHPVSGRPVDVHLANDAPPPRGWGNATAIGPNEGILFGGLAGDDELPLRLGDVWHLKVSEEEQPRSNL